MFAQVPVMALPILAKGSGLQTHGQSGPAGYVGGMKRDTDILIAGGGLNGPALALALAQGGFRVTVVDARPAPDRAEAGFDGSLLHGEAVAVGLGLAASISARLGHCSQEWPSRVIAHLAACGLPARISDLDRRFTVEALMGRMAKDKKNRDGRMRFVLLRGPGDVFTSADVPVEAVTALLREEGAAG